VRVPYLRTVLLPPPPALGIALGARVTCSLVSLGRTGPVRVAGATAAVGTAGSDAAALDDPDALARAVSEALRALPRRPRRAVVSLPADAVALRILTLPPLTRRELPPVLREEAARTLPYDISGTSLAWEVVERSRYGMRVLVAAARMDHVRAAVEALRRAGLRRWTVEPAPTALARAAAVSGVRDGAVVVHVGTGVTAFTAVSGGKAASCSTQQHAPGSAREVAAGLKRLLLALPGIGLALVCGPGAPPGIEDALHTSLGIEARPLQVGTVPAEEACAAGSALRTIFPVFRKDPAFPERVAVEPRPAYARALAAGLALCLAAASGAAYVERAADRRLASVRRERELPAAAAAEARRLLSERAEIERRLADVVPERSAPWPEIFTALAYSTPPGVRLLSVSLKAQGIGTITAEAESEAAAAQLARRLAAQPYFDEVRLDSLAAAASSGRLTVSISVSLRKGGSAP